MMENRFEGGLLQKAKSMDMVNYLSRMGIEPQSIKGDDFWYCSPLRQERTPSFKINRKKNVWYDFGTGKGGTLIDFAIQYHSCTIGEFLQSIKDTLLGSFPARPIKEETAGFDGQADHIKITRERKLWSYPLLNYLKSRHIDIQIADRYCCEVNYEFKGKTYYGIGFKNDGGGFAIRNAAVKFSSSPAGYTSIVKGSQRLAIFEGFMDFLSFTTLFKHLPENTHDFLILNSLSFFEKARPVMERYPEKLLYLDSGKQGRKCTTYALSLHESFRDESSLYAGYDDLNDFHCNFGHKEANNIEEPLSPKRRQGKGI